MGPTYIDQIAIKYINIYSCKTFQNLPKFGIFGLKTNHLATLTTTETEKKISKLTNRCRYRRHGKNVPKKNLPIFFPDVRTAGAARGYILKPKKSQFG
jgi:hypothetical protein